MTVASLTRGFVPGPARVVRHEGKPTQKRLSDGGMLFSQLKDLVRPVCPAEPLLGQEQIQCAPRARARTGQERHLQAPVGFVKERSQRHRHPFVERQEARESRLARFACGINVNVVRSRHGHSIISLVNRLLRNKFQGFFDLVLGNRLHRHIEPFQQLLDVPIRKSANASGAAGVGSMTA